MHSIVTIGDCIIDEIRFETEDPRRFVLVAISPGETCVEIEVLHEDHGCIPAVVLAAPN